MFGSIAFEVATSVAAASKAKDVGAAGKAGKAAKAADHAGYAPYDDAKALVEGYNMQFFSWDLNSG